MSAAKVVKSTPVSKASSRKATRRGTGTKSAVNSDDGGLVDKRAARRPAERERGSKSASSDDR